MKLRIRQKNLKGAFASVWFNIATSDRLSSASVEIDKYYSLTLPQPQPGSFSQRMEAMGETLGTRLSRPLSRYFTCVKGRNVTCNNNFD